MNPATALNATDRTAPIVTTQQRELIKRTIANGATDAELELFLFDCARQGVHPLDRMIHFTKRGNRYTPITSIDFMRVRAADTNEYAGSDDAVFFGILGEPEYAATVKVWRLVQGQLCSFAATARWVEYCPPSGQDTMWKKMPHTMLAKCAEALALRKGFPRQLAGLYAREEMDQAGPEIVAPAPPETFVDAKTGEEQTERPTPPTGYDYIASFSQSGQWFNVVWGGEEFKTKQPQIGAMAEQAYQQGVPVIIHSRKRPWLDKVERWAPDPRDTGNAVLTEDEVPF